MKVFLVAGEASGDRLGGVLMSGLRMLAAPQFAGVGGPMMQAQGLESLFPMEDLSVMGLAEVLPRYLHLRRRLAQTVAAAQETAPDVLITIDSPDFGLRVARQVRHVNPRIRTVHYVAPSVWAWRAGRAGKMARHVDHVLALLPFEPPLMEAAGMACDFVGHPVVAEPHPKASEVAAFRARHGIGDAPLLLVLPGSRRGEVTRLAPVFGAALKRVLDARPEMRLVLPTTAAMAPLVRDVVSGWPAPPLMLSPEDPGHAAEKACAFHAADLALAASGTVSLELAHARTPMVIAYDMAPLSRAILSRMIRVDTLTLVNLVSETRSVPEFIGRACRPEAIAPALLQVMAHPHAQKVAMEAAMQRLGEGGEGPGLRAARAVLARL